MRRDDATSAWVWVVAALAGAAMGLTLWWWANPFRAGKAPSQQQPRAAGKPESPRPNAPPESVGMRYARAYQRGAWDEVIDMTCWMRERLDLVRLEPDAPAALEQAREELRARLRTRNLADNQLRPEGVEDQYVFAPGTTLECAGSDAGRQDLEQPARERTWIAVTYPARSSALRDESGRPVHRLVVGVNVSTGGLVLKASVIGNLEMSEDVNVIWPYAPPSRR